MERSCHCCGCCRHQCYLRASCIWVLRVGSMSRLLFSYNAIAGLLLSVTDQTCIHAQWVRRVDGFGSRMVCVAWSTRSFAHFLVYVACHVIETAEWTDERALKLTTWPTRFSLVMDQHFGHMVVQGVAVHSYVMSAFDLLSLFFISQFLFKDFNPFLQLQICRL